MSKTVNRPSTNGNYLRGISHTEENQKILLQSVAFTEKNKNAQKINK